MVQGHGDLGLRGAPVPHLGQHVEFALPQPIDRRADEDDELQIGPVCRDFGHHPSSLADTPHPDAARVDIGTCAGPVDCGPCFGGTVMHALIQPIACSPIDSGLVPRQ